MISGIPENNYLDKGTMKIVILGSGMMGRAIAYDLSKYSNFESITITDKDRKTPVIWSGLESLAIPLRFGGRIKLPIAKSKRPRRRNILINYGTFGDLSGINNSDLDFAISD